MGAIDVRDGRGRDQTAKLIWEHRGGWHRRREHRGLRRLTIDVSEGDLRAIAERGYEGAVSNDHDQQAQAVSLFITDMLAASIGRGNGVAKIAKRRFQSSEIVDPRAPEPVPCRAVRIGGRVQFFLIQGISTDEPLRYISPTCPRLPANGRLRAGPVDKATWSQMAKRCLACAEHYDNQQAATDSRARDRNRRTHRRWAQTRGGDSTHR